jgi:hypothetical protein
MNDAAFHNADQNAAHLGAALGDSGEASHHLGEQIVDDRQVEVH